MNQLCDVHGNEHPAFLCPDLRGGRVAMSERPIWLSEEGTVDVTVRIRELENALTEANAKAAAAERENKHLRQRWAGTGKARLLWIWNAMHSREDTWAESVGYYGGESRRTVESAFFQAYDKLAAAIRDREAYKAALERLALGDAHAERIAEERHCPACFASLDFEKHDSDCYLAVLLGTEAQA